MTETIYSGIVDSLTKIKERIEKAANLANRDPSEITLIGVSKKQPVEKVNQFIKAGLNDIGENIVQEAEEKFPHLLPVKKHFIGYLQSNKVNKAVKLFDIIHSVDREKVIRKIVHAVENLNKSHYPVLVQVNFSGEETKHGCDPDQVEYLAEVLTSSNIIGKIKWVGLMTIAPLSLKTRNEKIEFYRDFHQFFLNIKKNYPEIDQLSMGMSQSFEEAILGGSTMVRIGTALFGPRNT